MNEYYKIAKSHYMEASMQMLEHFKKNVIELHHIGSTSIKKLNSSNGIDVLVILKTVTEVSELKDILIAEGYEVAPEFNRFFEEESVFHGKFGDCDVNFIFMSDRDKKSEILLCKELLLENDEYLQNFQELKQLHNDSIIDKDEYQHRKTEFFASLLKEAKDLNIV